MFPMVKIVQAHSSLFVNMAARSDIYGVAWFYISHGWFVGVSVQYPKTHRDVAGLTCR